MTQAPNETSEDQKLRKAYTNATSRLRDAHREEFNKYQKEEAKKLGVDWSPRPTKEDKAMASLETLLAENPGLMDRLAERLADRTGTTSG